MVRTFINTSDSTSFGDWCQQIHWWKNQTLYDRQKEFDPILVANETEILKHIRSPNEILLNIPVNTWILNSININDIVKLAQTNVVLLINDTFNNNDDDMYWIKNQHLLKDPTKNSIGYLPFTGVWACKASFVIETLKRKNNYIYRNVDKLNINEYFLELENKLLTYKTNDLVTIRHPEQWFGMMTTFKPRLQYRYHLIKDYEQRHLYAGVYFTRNKISLLGNEYENEFFRILSDYTVFGENILLINIDMENENIELY